MANEVLPISYADLYTRDERAQLRCRILPGKTADDKAPEMRKNQFKKAVRDKLRQVPLAIRRTWNESNLFVWWTAARASDSFLTWDQAPGDGVWQHVKVMCGELIGRDAAI